MTGRIMTRLTAGLAILSIAIGCAMAQDAPKAAEESYRLTISFISVCCGINSGAKAKLDEFISSYEKRKDVKLERETVHWGREGEVDYCFKLAELSSDGQKAFVLEIRSLLEKAERVHIEENAPCRNKRKK